MPQTVELCKPNSKPPLRVEIGNHEELFELVGPAALPVPGPDAKPSPNSKVKQFGKVPGLRRRDGSYSGFPNWTNFRATNADAESWSDDGIPGGAVQTREYPSFDIDVGDPELAPAICDVITDYAGFTAVRFREGSSRRLLMYRLAPGHQPIRKRSITFLDGSGRKHLVEVLGAGNHFVAFGKHKEGGKYFWNELPSAPNLIEITAEHIEKALVAVCELVKKRGCRVVTGSPAITSAAATRNGLDYEGHRAPSPEHVLELLNIYKNTHENVPTHNDLVSMVAAIWAALGPRRQEFRADIIEWILGFDGNTEEYAERVLDSIKDSALGWSWLTAQAHALGYTGDAEADFADGVGEEWTGGREPAPAEQKKLPRLYTLLNFAEQPVVHDFVEGFLRDGDLSVFYGPPNEGKTFAALDLGLRVSLGMPWHGRDVTARGVLYIAGEGAGGIGRRAQAFQHEHEIDPAKARFAFIAEMPNFREPRHIRQLIELVREAEKTIGPVGLIIVDTLARALAGGNENAPDDMGALVRGADRLRADTGAHVLFIHHTGKDDARGARGHSSLRGAVDTEVKVCRSETDGRTIFLNVEKQRDLEGGDTFAFALRPVELGTNTRGKPITSCVVEAAARKPELRKSSVEALQILNQILAGADETVVPLVDWRAAIEADGLLGGTNPDTRRKQWQRIRDELKNKGAIEIYGANVGVRS